MKRLLAALERIATALEQLVPAAQQATREARRAEPTNDDFNRLLSHVDQTRHVCSPPCARAVLATLGGA